MKRLISLRDENGEAVYDSDGKPMCETVDYERIEHSSDIITIHHPHTGSNASTTRQRYIDGKRVYDSSGRAIYDTFHYERWD